ncbi:Protein of unknown function [Lentzea waywayandensis]|uniref:DUF3099 domain-containing protein n=1 Tax=Lentzea waywayandensis TaxID=84724 RepID=A0A1I6DD64_9PSEU|nr:DUF3099 domain-containing protein [Lentzea waywayandensis]SFR03327.1 Protein of unknown function [Lentzea waywayandensis]
MNSHRNENPVLITSAAPSYEDQLAARRRRYALMMSLRIPCILLALLFAKIWWLALILILLSVPLPWMAVLIANDRPPRKAEAPQRMRPSRPALTAGDGEEPR